jgi:hypothetical protein
LYIIKKGGGVLPECYYENIDISFNYHNIRGKYMFKARTGKVYVPNIVFVLDTFKTVKVNCVLGIILAVKWEITHKINETHIF